MCSKPGAKRPPTLADVRPGVEGVALGALAGEAARGVPAQAVLTQQPVDQALVDVWGGSTHTHTRKHAEAV